VFIVVAGDIFFLIRQILYQKRKGRNPQYTGGIQKGLGGEREQGKKIYKANSSRGKPACNPKKESNKKKMEELLSSPW
jgi:hypothetical protein